MKRLLTPADRPPKVGDTLCWPSEAYGRLTTHGVLRVVKAIVTEEHCQPYYQFADRTLHPGSRLWHRITYARRKDGGPILVEW